MSDLDRLAHRALEHIPTLLTLQDRNPHSPTFGCFDRNFWHYRIIDFPSGMAQEMVWPLALASELEIPSNPYVGSDALRRWAEAGIAFGMNSAHADGSCDDYFPFERAGGAASFSLLAFIETYKILGLDNEQFLEFFIRRTRWLENFHESGKLTNHQALIAIIFELMNDLTGTDEWTHGRDQRIERILSWQHEEGWFQEYEGFDPGYQTITISLLAWLDDLRPELGLRPALVRAVDIAGDVIYPDGAYGGELGSRNTYNYFPHGFEVVGRWEPSALATNDRFLAGLRAGRESSHTDDHHIQHHVWNYLLAWRDAQPRTGEPLPPRTQGRTIRPSAGFVVERRGDTELYLNTRKGGVFRLYRDDLLVAADAQISVMVNEGKAARNAVAHLVDEYDVVVDNESITISGQMGWAKHTQMTSTRLVALRLVMKTIGRWSPNLIRRFLQRILIVGKKKAPLRFRRRLTWKGSRLIVTDQLTLEPGTDVTDATIEPAQGSIYVTMSRTFQQAQLEPGHALERSGPLDFSSERSW